MGETVVVEAAPKQDLVMLALVTRELEVEIEDIGPDVGDQIVPAGPSRWAEALRSRGAGASATARRMATRSRASAARA